MGTRMYQFQHKLKALKARIRMWNNEDFGNQNMFVRNSRKYTSYVGEKVFLLHPLYYTSYP